ncbi:uncharacterized protein METZ01_LOCUS387597 [marine metagenome]|uniref:Uncharacterized protein n=1 Tax=marine metagenome TaxID=408172 RepID=A0A382UKE3_9ZZZZ
MTYGGFFSGSFRKSYYLSKIIELTLSKT